MANFGDSFARLSLDGSLDTGPAATGPWEADQWGEEQPPSQPITMSSLTEDQLRILSTDNHPHLWQFQDITEHLSSPMSMAAEKVGLSLEKFAKRFQEAAGSREWPYEAVLQIDEEITTLLRQFEDSDRQSFSKIEESLAGPMETRTKLLSGVVIRIGNPPKASKALKSLYSMLNNMLYAP